MGGGSKGQETVGSTPKRTKRARLETKENHQNGLVDETWSRYEEKLFFDLQPEKNPLPQPSIHCRGLSLVWLLMVGGYKAEALGGGVRLRHATSRPPPADPNTKTVSGGGGPARCSGGRVPLRGTARPSPTGSPRLRRGGRGPGPARGGPPPSDHQSGTVGPHPRGDRQAEAVVGKRAPTNSVGDHRRRNSRTARCSGAA